MPADENALVALTRAELKLLADGLVLLALQQPGRRDEAVAFACAHHEFGLYADDAEGDE